MAGYLSVAVPFEYSDDGGFDSCRRMRLIVGIIWIGLEREGIADFKPIGFGERSSWTIDICLSDAFR